MFGCDRIRKAGALVTACLSLAACQTLPQVAGAGFSRMNSEDTQLRQSLVVTPQPLPRGAIYAPFRCSYQVYNRRVNEEPVESQLRVTTTRVRERLLITINEGPNTSTALISATGQIFDFNVRNFLGGGRYDSGTYQQAMQGRAGHVNELSVVFPYYSSAQPVPGQAASNLENQDRLALAKYFYRGTATYSGTNVGVFDLMLPSPDGGPAVILGFALMDTSTMAPVLVVIDGTWSLRFERTACS